MNGDGISFFIAPLESKIPVSSNGGYLGLFSPENATDASANCIVAVDFDTWQNDWDSSADHVGIDVNSIVSVANIKWESSMK